MTSTKNPATVYLSKWLETSDSYKTMRGALDRIAGLLEPGADVESFAWHELRYADVRAIPARLKGAKLKPRTINKALSALRGVLDSAWRLGLIPEEAYRSIEIKNEGGRGLPSGHPLTNEQMGAVELAIDQLPAMEAALIAVLAGAGLRRVEVVRLMTENYNPSTGRIVAYGKRNKERSIPVGRRWREAIKRWWLTRKADELLFPLTGKDPRKKVSAIVEAMSEKCGIAFTPHDLRHTFGTHVERVAGIKVAQQLMGHENIQTTGIYVHVDEEREYEAVKDL